TTGALGTKYMLTSFFARAAYNFDDIFYATASLRRDGSSTLEPDQHSYFPAISLAYSFKNILASAGWISDMKLKAGYGVTGNNTDQYGNPVLQWEQVRGRNIGLDFSLFSGRLSGDMEYFNDQTRDLLLLGVLPSPPFVPGTALTNGGSLTNKGFELSLSAWIISGQKLSWTAYGQITFINTKVTDLSSRYTYNGQTYNLNTSQLPDGYAEGRGLSLNPIMFIKTGYSPYVFYLPHFTGVDAQGNQTFDGKTIQQNPNPQGYYIDAAPKFNYGITNSFDYGNWNLNVALRGVYGQKVFDNTLLNVETITRLPYNNVTKEALTNGIKDAPVASDKWLENASYLRLDNIQLSYSFKNVSFASVLRVFVAANNLFVITAYKGLDPEVKTSNSPANNNFFFGRNITGSQNQPYIDNNYNGQAYYPMARTFSLGVNVSLK
ncbi:MAG TPA: TonB-dependent receptor, partial [Mucilaginibacter sp.]|nr:TonB-dependent receptor [Mucilaginibacter sp.]